MTLMQFTIDSQVLQMKNDVNVLMPDVVKPENTPLKVLWLLHGGVGDQYDWLLHTRLDYFASQYPNLAVILPNVYYSNFVDMAHGQKFAQYLGEELVGKMRALLPALSHKREDNWIAGFSNGGYGCFHVGLLYPETFGAIGGFAAGDKADADFSYRMKDKERVFGSGEMKGTSLSTRQQAIDLAASDLPKPIVFHGCGEKDPWHHMNVLVRETFESIPGDPYHYEYAEVPGEAHSTKAMEVLVSAFMEKMLKG